MYQAAFWALGMDGKQGKPDPGSQEPYMLVGKWILFVNRQTRKRGVVTRPLITVRQHHLIVWRSEPSLDGGRGGGWRRGSLGGSICKLRPEE